MTIAWIIQYLNQSNANIITQINIEVFKNLCQIAGILSGFALTAGIQILSSHNGLGPLGGKQNTRPQILNSVRFFFYSCVLLIGAFASLAVIESYAAPMVGKKQEQYLLTLLLFGSISTDLLIIGSALLMVGLFITLLLWGKRVPGEESCKPKVIHNKNWNNLYALPGKLPLIIIIFLVTIYIILCISLQPYFISKYHLIF